MDGVESESKESIGGVESESEAFDFQPLPFQRNESLSTINDVMMSSDISIPRSTIKNVESRKFGSISMISQISSIHGESAYESENGTHSMSRSEGYSEYSSTMSIEEREYWCSPSIDSHSGWQEN